MTQVMIAVPPAAPQRRGRKPKYATAEERMNAILASRKKYEADNREERNRKMKIYRQKRAAAKTAAVSP